MKIHYGHHQVNAKKFLLKKKTNIFIYIYIIKGKGIWVGLILLTTGLVGILASHEQTPTSYIGFTVLSGLSTILSFYLIITCIIPVRYDTNNSDNSTPRWLSNELIVNSLLIAVGGFGCIIGVISTLIGSIGAGCWYDQRELYTDLYSDDPTRIL